jgi:hypothetical protein
MFSPSCYRRWRLQILFLLSGALIPSFYPCPRFISQGIKPLQQVAQNPTYGFFKKAGGFLSTSVLSIK